MHLPQEMLFHNACAQGLRNVAQRRAEHARNVPRRRHHRCWRLGTHFGVEDSLGHHERQRVYDQEDLDTQVATNGTF